MTWQLIHLDTPENTERALSEYDSLVDNTSSASPLHDLRWFLDGEKSDPSLFFLLYRDDEGNSGTCLLRKHHRPVKVTLGEFVIYQYPLDRYELWASPNFKTADVESGERILQELLDLLHQNMSGRDALSIEGLAVNSPLFGSLHKQPNQPALCLQLGKAFMHQSIIFPGTFNDYVSQMSKRSRKSVQYSQRKLHKDFSVRLFACNAPGLIDLFLDDAIKVSQKTYQWNLLGLGLRDKDAYRDILSHWSRHAEIYCFLLYCDNSPTAFMLGYIYNSCYYYIDVGYDPDWSSYSVGSVLQLSVIEELYGIKNPPGYFDFSTGYGEHKGRFGNREQEEVNMLVLQATLRNRAFLFFYKIVEATSDTLVGLFDKLGIKKKLKRIIRRSAQVTK